MDDKYMRDGGGEVKLAKLYYYLYPPRKIISILTMFKAKLRKIGNSIGVIIPLNVITGYKIGEEIELDIKKSKESYNKPEGLNKKLVFSERKGIYENYS